MDWMPIAVVVLGIPLSLAIWLIVRAVSARNRIEALSRRLKILELEISRLKSEQAPRAAQPVIAQESAELGPAPHAPRPEPAGTLPERLLSETRMTPPPPEPVPPVLSPPPLPPVRRPEAAPGRGPLREVMPRFNWEQFMGVKLFAWIAGLALFLGVAFFVKYSFDNNLVSPELRVALGFIAGLGLLVGGVFLSRRDYAVLSQTLCATGVVILYAVTFACRSIYNFEFFGPVPTFLLMVLITTTAFLLAVRLDALVVAILGMLGGFLTPVLLSTGQDNPLGLFGYIAILDAGLILVALHRRWFFLAALGAAGTVLMQIGWTGKFFVAEKYFEGNKILIALGVLFGFTAMYLAAAWWAKVRRQPSPWFWGSTLGLAAVALAFTAWFLTFIPLAQRPWLMFGFVFLIDLAVTALTALEPASTAAHPIAGLAVFGLLTFWTARSLNDDLLNAALVCYFVFAVVHSAFPPFLQRWRGLDSLPGTGQIFPPLALALVFIPILRLAEVSFLVWPFVLLVDLLAIGLAAVTVSLLPVLAVLVLTLGATGALIFKIPATLTGLPTSFFLLGAFAVFFVVIGLWLARRFKPEAFAGGIKFGDDLSDPVNLAAQLPAFSAALPFLLLIMATLRLPLANPSPIFGLALLLVVMMLGVTKLFSLEGMPAIGLACVAALECAWHFNRFDPARAGEPLVWYLVFFAVFALFPFPFLRQFSGQVTAWATAALSGLPQFFLIHRLVSAAYPNEVMGLLPAAFVIPPLASLVVVLKKIPASSAARMAQLAWFGGAALFFVTLIFPIQFQRQWITIGWALEGAALLWLFHRLPHPGLRLAGAGLLVAAFVRLAVNRAVFDYHPRSPTPIFNWYLYAYGIVTICLFAGAKLLAPARTSDQDRPPGPTPDPSQEGSADRPGPLPGEVRRGYVGARFLRGAPPVLAGLGTVLAFELLNIEIADFFSAPGSTLTFQFSGNFARDMTYSIAWALFALLLLVGGIVRKTPAPRYAALGLFSITLVKLFFHDLARLGQLYRIGAFIGVAVIAMVASFAYQRFFIALGKERENATAQ